MNATLFSKWWWRLYTQWDLQWNKRLQALYYNRRKPLNEEKTFILASHWWKSVLKTKEIFKSGSCFALGDGHLIDFWSNRWCDEGLLRSFLSDIYSKAIWKKALLKECSCSNGWRWRMEMKKDLERSWVKITMYWSKDKGVQGNAW